MRIPRIYIPHSLHPGDEVQVPGQSGEHITRVLRLERGHALVLFNGDGKEYQAELTLITKHAVGARVLDSGTAVNRESPLNLTLAQGIARGDKMDWILQKATELGIHRIVPLFTDRTEVKLDADRTERRMVHWQNILISACEQCRRSCVPQIAMPMRLATWAASLDESAGLRLALDPTSEISVRKLPAFTTATLVIGPEGGLSEHDITTLKQAKFSGLSLGPRILRTETAGLTAIAALQAIYGDG